MKNDVLQEPYQPWFHSLDMEGEADAQRDKSSESKRIDKERGTSLKNPFGELFSAAVNCEGLLKIF